MLTNRKHIITIISILAMVLLLSIFCNNVQIAYANVDNEIYYGVDLSYGGANSQSQEIENINYATKVEKAYKINTNFPQYYNMNGVLNNSCAAIAGSNIIGYYDRYYDDLIPECNVGVLRNNTYRYLDMIVASAQKQKVIDALYKDMKINQVNAGCTRDDYMNGLSKYVNRQGRYITFNDIMSVNKIDIDKLDAQLRSGNPVSLFLQRYNISTVNDNGSKVVLTKDVFSANHIMVAYGYKKTDYFDNAGTLIKTCIYLDVSSGIKDLIGCYVICDNDIINNADAVKIY